MLNKEKLNQICTLPRTAEHKIIKVLYEHFHGAVKAEKLFPALPTLSRSQILLHVRKSVYLTRDKDTSIIKLVRRPDPHEGSTYGRLYDIPSNAGCLQDFVFSVFWAQPKIKDIILNKLVIEFCSGKGISCAGFIANKNIGQTIKKGVTKFKNAQ